MRRRSSGWIGVVQPVPKRLLGREPGILVPARVVIVGEALLVGAPHHHRDRLGDREQIVVAQFVDVAVEPDIDALRVVQRDPEREDAVGIGREAPQDAVVAFTLAGLADADRPFCRGARAAAVGERARDGGDVVRVHDAVPPFTCRNRVGAGLREFVPRLVAPHQRVASVESPSKDRQRVGPVHPHQDSGFARMRPRR